MENQMNYKLGDKVKLGLFGNFDDDDKEVFEIVDIDKCPYFLGGYQFHVENDKGEHYVAFIDEIKPC